jgi:ADP-ribose pyrophosphatase YjhB (NUDIX family)
MVAHTLPDLAGEQWYTRPENVPDRIGAGGVVLRKADQEWLVALVQERDIGDTHHVLPKGGVDPGEEILDAAHREIYEETSLKDLELVRKLAVLERCNFKQTRWQATHYFLFTTTQIEGASIDPDNFGFGWHSLHCLPTMVWPDERSLVENLTIPE